MTRNRSFTILGLALLVVGLLAIRHKRVIEKNHAPLVTEIPTAVQVASVRQGPLESAHHVLGEVRAADEAEIAPRVSGEVREVLVREGDTVTRGAVLVRLDTAELEDALSAAAAEVEGARVAQEAQAASTSRDSILFLNNAISREAWEHSQAVEAAAAARLEMARRRRGQAQIRLGYALARAPFDGVVSSRMVDPGDLAVPGKPILRMVKQSSVRVRGEIPPALLAKIHRGTPVDLTLGDHHVPAAVSRIFPAMESSHLATFEVDVPRPPSGFVAGATVGVDLYPQSGEGLLVPADALLDGTAGTHAFVMAQSADSTFTLRVVAVTVITRSLDQAIVEGDLHEGDDVVVALPSRLMSFSAGMKVRPVDVNSGR